MLHRRPGVRVAGLLALPMTWMVLVYLAPLALLFVTAFWTTDSFTGLVVQKFSLDNFQEILTEPAYRRVVLRTVSIAALVTVLCTLIGLPMAFFMARVATARWQPLLVALVLTPLWASYLVKVYAWRTILAPDGPAQNFFGATPGYGLPVESIRAFQQRIFKLSLTNLSVRKNQDLKRRSCHVCLIFVLIFIFIGAALALEDFARLAALRRRADDAFFLHAINQAGGASITDPQAPLNQRSRGALRGADNRNRLLNQTVVFVFVFAFLQERLPGRHIIHFHAALLPVGNDALDFHVSDQHTLCANRRTHFRIQEEHIALAEQTLRAGVIEDDAAIYAGGDSKR